MLTNFQKATKTGQLISRSKSGEPVYQEYYKYEERQLNQFVFLKYCKHCHRALIKWRERKYNNAVRCVHWQTVSAVMWSGFVRFRCIPERVLQLSTPADVCLHTTHYNVTSVGPCAVTGTCQWRRSVVKYGGSGSVRSSQQTVTDYTNDSTISKRSTIAVPDSL